MQGRSIELDYDDEGLLETINEESRFISIE
jgi:hypothetical protein